MTSVILFELNEISCETLPYWVMRHVHRRRCPGLTMSHFNHMPLCPTFASTSSKAPARKSGIIDHLLRAEEVLKGIDNVLEHWLGQAWVNAYKKCIVHDRV